jgi:hypothetical protein
MSKTQYHRLHAACIYHTTATISVTHCERFFGWYEEKIPSSSSLSASSPSPLSFSSLLPPIFLSPLLLLRLFRFGDDDDDRTPPPPLAVLRDVSATAATPTSLLEIQGAVGRVTSGADDDDCRAVADRWGDVGNGKGGNGNGAIGDDANGNGGGVALTLSRSASSSE